MPRQISLSDEVVKLLDEATAALHRLGDVGRLIPNPHLLIGPHLRLEAVLSSRIEGTKTDVSQLLRFEAGEIASADAADDAAEVRSYVVALEHGLDRIAGASLCRSGCSARCTSTSCGACAVSTDSPAS